MATIPTSELERALEREREETARYLEEARDRLNQINLLALSLQEDRTEAQQEINTRLQEIEEVRFNERITRGGAELLRQYVHEAEQQQVWTDENLEGCHAANIFNSNLVAQFQGRLRELDVQIETLMRYQAAQTDLESMSSHDLVNAWIYRHVPIEYTLFIIPGNINLLRDAFGVARPHQLPPEECLIESISAQVQRQEIDTPWQSRDWTRTIRARIQPSQPAVPSENSGNGTAGRVRSSNGPESAPVAPVFSTSGSAVRPRSILGKRRRETPEGEEGPSSSSTAPALATAPGITATASTSAHDLPVARSDNAANIPSQTQAEVHAAISPVQPTNNPFRRMHVFSSDIRGRAPEAIQNSPQLFTRSLPPQRRSAIHLDVSLPSEMESFPDSEPRPNPQQRPRTPDLPTLVSHDLGAIQRALGGQNMAVMSNEAAPGSVAASRMEFVDGMRWDAGLGRWRY
ncbi:uncharacterized protein PAC_01612 [Phialocephala subalpina]|uniref:Uncharacterized protein n=1 Tax=Phialocephala subalpina TaxID=576137 RepID=A0A1L7WG30_9HELO|nr:uncharacterized protein PAC_01612 [Phialocephala subalpina]